MTKGFIAFVAALFMAAPVYSQTCQPEEIAYKVKNEAFNNSKVEELSQYMTDRLGSRLAASQMKLRAEKLVIDKLNELGLSNPRAEFASEFTKGGWDNLKNYVAMTAPYYCSFAANPKAWSGSTDGLVKGECMVLDVNEIADLDKYKGKLAGKIVLMPEQRKYELSFRPMASRYTDEQLNDMTKDRRPSSGSWSRGSYNPPTEDHGRMVRLVNSGEKVEMELDIKNQFTDNQRINNIIAEIPGTDPKLKNEIVLIGAHLDSWHGGTGGADNAAGCITMMEAMRILKAIGVSPRRTIRLALWGGEEQGLYGSRGYADKYLYDSDKKKAQSGYDDFVIYMNMDFGSGRFRGVYLEENDMAYPFFEAWKKPLASLGFETLSPRRVGSTDHVSFSSLGLPAYQFIQDPLDYFRAYHTTMDTYERMSIDDLKVNAAIVAWLAYNAAMDNGRIPVKPGFPDKLAEDKK